MSAHRNLQHAIDNDCQDPDCEIHNPEVIEDQASRITAESWFLAGALSLIDLMDNVEGNEDDPNPSTEYIQGVALAELRDAHNLRT